MSEVEVNMRRETVLAPPPDFRWVGLEPGPRVSARRAAALVGVSATLGAAVTCGFTSRIMLATAAIAGLSAVAVRVMAPPPPPPLAGGSKVPMAIVPWGVLVESDEVPRVLRWPAVENVSVQMVHGVDSGTPSTLWSFVTVETARERFSGRAPGAVPLDRLEVNVEAYAREAGHVASLDLGGTAPGEGPLEPEVEPLIASAWAYLASAPASSALGLPSGGYRSASARTVSGRAIEHLRGVLRDRSDRPCDPRAFAAVLAAELRARELADDLLALVQAPHPLIAAVAKVAAHKLGVPRARAGALDEVAPFLMPRDVEVLGAWGAA
jgi:hypothetical protein